MNNTRLATVHLCVISFGAISKFKFGESLPVTPDNSNIHKPVRSIMVNIQI